MWQYETTVVWRSEKEGWLHASGNPKITVATPPDFGGPHNEWSPEQLLMGAIGSCLMTSALYYLRKSGIELRSYMSNVAGTLGKTREGLAFTRIDVEVSITVGASDDVEKAQRADEKAQQTCLVSKAMKCTVNVNSLVNVHGTGEA